MPALASAIKWFDEDQAPAATAGVRKKRVTDRDGAVQQEEILEFRAGLRDNRAVSLIGFAKPLGLLKRIEALSARGVEQPGGEPERHQGRALGSPERASEHVQGASHRSPEPHLIGHHQASAYGGETIASEAGQPADHFSAHPVRDQPTGERGAAVLPQDGIVVLWLRAQDFLAFPAARIDDIFSETRDFLGLLIGGESRQDRCTGVHHAQREDHAPFGTSTEPVGR